MCIEINSYISSAVLYFIHLYIICCVLTYVVCDFCGGVTTQIEYFCTLGERTKCCNRVNIQHHLVCKFCNVFRIIECTSAPFGMQLMHKINYLWYVLLGKE